MNTIYSKPGCQQCRLTYAALDAKGIPYVVVDLSDDAEAFEYVTNTLGFRALPVVEIAGVAPWVGFRPDLIEAVEHRDLSQRYDGHAFLTLCSCGAEIEGQTPDDADAAHMEHAARA